MCLDLLDQQVILTDSQSNSRQSVTGFSSSLCAFPMCIHILFRSLEQVNLHRDLVQQSCESPMVHLWELCLMVNLVLLRPPEYIP